MEIMISTQSGVSFPIVHVRLLQPEECDKLFEQMAEGSEEARKELIERHVRLVASIALKFRMSNVDMEDIG